MEPQSYIITKHFFRTAQLELDSLKYEFKK
jgi:hypothetical protein